MDFLQHSGRLSPHGSLSPPLGCFLVTGKTKSRKKSPSPSSVLKNGNIRHHGMSQGQSFRSGDFIVVISWQAMNFQGHRVKPVKMGIKIQPRCPTVAGIFHQIEWWPKVFYHKCLSLCFLQLHEGKWLETDILPLGKCSK